MYLKKLFSLALFLGCILWASAAVAAPARNDEPVTGSVNAIRTSLQPDLTLKSSLSPELLPQRQLAGGGTCRCSCGFRCKTNADCGPGGVCAPGITCCNRSPQDPQNTWLPALASRSGIASEPTIQCK